MVLTPVRVLWRPSTYFEGWAQTHNWVSLLSKTQAPQRGKKGKINLFTANDACKKKMHKKQTKAKKKKKQIEQKQKLHFIL